MHSNLYAGIRSVLPPFYNGMEQSERQWRHYADSGAIAVEKFNGKHPANYVRTSYPLREQIFDIINRSVWEFFQDVCKPLHRIHFIGLTACQ